MLPNNNIGVRIRSFWVASLLLWVAGVQSFPVPSKGSLATTRERTSSLMSPSPLALSRCRRRAKSEVAWYPQRCAQSPLFGGTSSALATTKTSITKRETSYRRRSKLYRWVQAAVFSIFISLLPCISPRAGASTAIQQSAKAMAQLIPWRSMVQVLATVWSIALIASQNRVKKRQARMATSEWSRYAQYPAARGRAIMWLMVQQALIILASQIVRTRRSSIRQYAGEHFADSLLKLGPLYIKLGQIISCRKNLLGPEWIDAMATLQDKVPASTGQEALELAYSSLDGGQMEFEELFSDFDATPLAAASLGQVHKATLRSNGEIVAVKIQRPSLRKIYDQDLEFLTTIAQAMDKLPSRSKNVGGVASSWRKIFQDAEEILYREIDYRDEASNAVRFAEDLGLTVGGNPIKPMARARNNQTLPSAAEWIRTPYVYQNVSNERLLVMEYVPSIKVTNQAKLLQANITALEQADLADALARAYLRQFCCNLFFSTDPHPGNVGVEIVPETGKPRLVLYDFGQAAALTQDQADGILQIIEAIIDMNVDRSIQAFQKMGVLVDGADLQKVRSKVSENYRTGKVKANRKSLRRKGYQFKDDTTEVNNLTPTAESSEPVAKDLEVMSFFTLPAEYAFVARAISQMDGVGKSLDPDFDFISNSAPYIVEIKGADKYLLEEVKKFFRDVNQKVNDFQMNHFPELSKISSKESPSA